MIDYIKNIAENSIFTGVTNICSILGFILTIIVAIKTSKINNILKYNDTIVTYNKERKSFKNIFEGHRKSIDEDGVKSNGILKDILKDVEEYSSKFEDILKYKEKILIYRFKNILKKEVDEVDFNKVSNYLAILTGRLSKKGDVKNG